MRKLTALGLTAGAFGIFACASPGTLPGGPPDTEAPFVTGFTPDSGAVNFRGRAVTVQFDETISDRGTGASALEALVLISPRDGEPRVNWSRNRIAVRPRDGFLPNTAYRITIAPGIADIRGNRSTVAQSVVFSTGSTIPRGEVAGVAFDWPGPALARTAFVEAVRLPDSTVFVAPADSSGAFTVGPLPPATYIVRGYVDENRNRVRDRLEAWDSVRVVVGVEPVAELELLLAPRDTLPPRVQTVNVTDSVTLAIEFDKPLDPDQEFSPMQLRVVAADSTVIPVTALYTRAQYDSVRQLAADSAARAARDSTRAARGDSALVDTLRAAPRADSVRADTAGRRARPSRPAPPRAFVVVLGAPLQPGTTYRITALGFRSLTGREDEVTRTFTVPPRVEPAPGDTIPTTPADTLRATPPRVPADTARPVQPAVPAETARPAPRPVPADTARPAPPTGRPR